MIINQTRPEAPAARACPALAGASLLGGETMSPERTRMQTMPTIMSDGVQVPTLPAGEWNRLVLAMIGRPITPEERRKIQRMAGHNWTARVTAEAILNRDLTSQELTVALRLGALNVNAAAVTAGGVAKP